MLAVLEKPKPPDDRILEKVGLMKLQCLAGRDIFSYFIN